jgi:hypothetical protein
MIKILQTFRSFKSIMFEFFICFALVLAILEIVKNFNVAKVQFILVPRVFWGKTLVLSGHVTQQKLIAQGGVAKCQITCFHRKR